MGYFSNGTEGMIYQEQYCFRCAYWNDDAGCPVWFLHELHVGESQWQATLDVLIPRNGVFNAECATFLNAKAVGMAKNKALTPGQQKGLEEWRRSA